MAKRGQYVGHGRFLLTAAFDLTSGDGRGRQAKRVIDASWVAA